MGEAPFTARLRGAAAPKLGRAIAGLGLGGHAAAPWRGGVGRVSRSRVEPVPPIKILPS